MKSTASSLFLALMALPLAINAAAVPAADAPVPSAADIEVVPETNSTSSDAELEKRQHCTLELRWTSNWDEIGRRYRVRAKAIPDGGVYWNSWKMAEDWALRCRSMPYVQGWDNYPKAWQDANDPAIAYCDVSFIHGSKGHNEYLWWHEGAAQSWARAYPGCIVDKQI